MNPGFNVVILVVSLVILILSAEQYGRFFITGRLTFASKLESWIIVVVWLALVLGWIYYTLTIRLIDGGIMAMVFIASLLRQIRIEYYKNQ